MATSTNTDESGVSDDLAVAEAALAKAAADAAATPPVEPAPEDAPAAPVSYVGNYDQVTGAFS